ncbi:MAG TPA: GNAT family protein [Sedimentisphaerales bacterium]|jgi:RimJ/RimL family protein N-acetyltransferase|nr:GNAT family protein [Sedimentisphaerales bacterium]HNU28251.1 GNAT family protein [Sedimentisphaerales bacterium]
MRIEFGEYAIRDWSGGDAGAIARYANNPNVAIWLRDRFPCPYRLSDAKVFLGKVARQNPQTVFAIATQEEAVGGIGLEFRDDVHRFTAELGYWLGEPFWGRGIMTEAVRAFTAWSFEHFEVHRIYASVFDGNDASVRVLEKAGFQREGRLRASVFKHERILDQLLYARIDEPIR